MKQHKWHKEIKAWADGAEIESKSLITLKGTKSYWKENKYPRWDNSSYEYRIKPQPKEPQYLQVIKRIATGDYYLAEAYPFNDGENTFKYIGKIKLETEE